MTIKSDDITGRTQAYRAIVKNESIKRPSVPESFHVLVKELQALGLKMDLLEQGELDHQKNVYAQRMEEVETLSAATSIVTENE